MLVLLIFFPSLWALKQEFHYKTILLKHFYNQISGTSSPLKFDYENVARF